LPVQLSVFFNVHKIVYRVLVGSDFYLIFIFSCRFPYNYLVTPSFQSLTYISKVYNTTTFYSLWHKIKDCNIHTTSRKLNPKTQRAVCTKFQYLFNTSVYGIYLRFLFHLCYKWQRIQIMVIFQYFVITIVARESLFFNCRNYLSCSL